MCEYTHHPPHPKKKKERKKKENANLVKVNCQQLNLKCLAFKINVELSLNFTARHIFVFFSINTSIIIINIMPIAIRETCPPEVRNKSVSLPSQLDVGKFYESEFFSMRRRSGPEGNNLWRDCKYFWLVDRRQMQDRESIFLFWNVLLSLVHFKWGLFINSLRSNRTFFPNPTNDFSS